MVIVEALSGSFDQYLFSSHAPEWMDYLVKTWQLRRYFQEIFCSGWEKVSKTDERFFEIALEKSGKDPGEIIYIDDREEHLKTGEVMGMKVVWCQDGWHQDAGGLKEKLRPFLGDDKMLL